MSGVAAKRFGKFFGKVKDGLEKLSETVITGEPDIELIHTLIQRIDVEGERVPGLQPGTPLEAEDQEETYQKLIRRLSWQISRSGITAEEVIRTFPGEVQAVLLYRSYDKYKGEESNLLRVRFIEMGWKNIQPNLWVLPPNKTPGGSVNSMDLKVWLRRKLVKPFGKHFDYVFPVVTVVDMKRVTADKKGIRKMPTARTIYNVLKPDEVVPASHLYSVMKTRGFSVREIILSGSIPLLASAFVTPGELTTIQENEDAIVASLKQMTGSQQVNLQDIANLGPDLLADAFGSTLPHGRDLAQRLIVEAQYWMRHLGGTVPQPGPIPAPAPAAPQAEESAQPAQQAEQWGPSREQEPAGDEAEPVASEESWYGPGEAGAEAEAEPAEEPTVAEAEVMDEGQ